ncbi:MAG: tRNA pseudouridine(38-40) synthase TruA [Phycisphaerae bacterium]
MQRNIRLLRAYDGTEFHGWQRQPGLRTVQGVLEQAARRVLRHQVQIIGSGRTDAGVHAAGQVANFFTDVTIGAGGLFRAIGARLPKDVTLVRLSDAPPGFHATRGVVSKLYRYRVYAAAGRPVERFVQRQTYHFWQELDVERMQEAARYFLGRQDFAAMASKGSERETTVRTVLRCQVYRHYSEIRFDVEGDGFLYNQVRNMVGTLLEVGRGHWQPEAVGQILASGDRRNAGPTAPARGLCLQWVRYDMAAYRLAEPVEQSGQGLRELADASAGPGE